MKVSSGTTVFQVSDVDAAIRFYRETLGFHEDFRFGAYAGVSLGKLRLHLCGHHVWERPVGGGAVVAFVEDCDAYCNTIRQRGANIRAEPADQAYGARDFVVSDPDGNVLTFSSEL